MICNIVVKLEKQESTTAVQENEGVGAQLSMFCFLKGHKRLPLVANPEGIRAFGGPLGSLLGPPGPGRSTF